MLGRTFPTLRELRERLLGYRQESVARFSGIASERLEALERDSSDLSVWEAERLAQLYGVEADALAETPIVVEDVGVTALASHDEFRDVADSVRVRVVAVATAARDLRRLEQLAGLPRPALEPLLPQLPRPNSHELPHRQGAVLAQTVRRNLGLGEGPLASVRDLCTERFPRIALLYAHLSAEGPAGLTFADAVRGPVIVLNLDGKNANPAFRRFSLAHELCHLLVDWERTEPLAILSGFLTELALDRERRANAFAVRLLCPESVVRAAKPDQPIAVARRLLAEYGLHYNAARLYLHNESSIELPPIPPVGLGTIGSEPWVERAEDPSGLASFPLPSVPPERRTSVAELAARAYASGQILRDELAELLGVTPAHEVERVVDFFGLPLPSRDAA